MNDETTVEWPGSGVLSAAGPSLYECLTALSGHLSAADWRPCSIRGERRASGRWFVTVQLEPDVLADAIRATVAADAVCSGAGLAPSADVGEEVPRG